MAGTEADILDEAIAGTEKEIFSEAFGDEPVDTAEAPDTSLEEMEDLPSEVTGSEAKGEDADEAGEGEAGADGKDEGEQPDDKQPRDDKGKFAADEKSKAGEPEKPRKGDTSVPLKVERERARTLEADLAKERQERAAEKDGFKAEFAKLEGRLDQVLRNVQQPAKAAEDTSKTQAEPDIFTDPDGWKKWNAEQSDKRVAAVQNSFEERLLNASLADAHEKHGKAFEAAYGAMAKLDPQNPAHRAIVSNIRTAPNPGAMLMRWHKQQETLARVGDDPDAFINGAIEKALEAKMKDPEFRKQTLAAWQAEARGGGDQDNSGRPRNIIRNPKSLNSEGGRSERASDVAESDGSEKAIFDSAFA